jgi:uncharacterized protein (DUF302 family)
MINYGFTKELDIPYEQAIEKVTARLADEGFGILSRIDVREKFREKLGIDFPKYVILGACNPANAHSAILAEQDIGLMLPCNVIVYEKEGKTVVSVIKPTAAMQMINNKDLQEIAATVEAKLSRVISSLT